MVSAKSDRRAAIVTGATGAVGGAVIERLQTEGYRVAGLDLSGGAGDLPLTVDLTDRDQMRAAAENAERELGPLSVLVTAHGYHAAAPFGTMEHERWNDLLLTHLGGTVNACAAVVPGMVQAGRGTVVTTSSWLALAGIPGEAYYAAATGTVLAFTKSFSLEVAASGVRVNCIAIGPLEGGERTFAWNQPEAAELAIRSYGKPSDVAETVSFLIRDGDFFVGQIFSAVSGAVV